MSDTLPLSPRPDPEHYRKLAEEFHRAGASDDKRAAPSTTAGIDPELEQLWRRWERLSDANKKSSASTLKGAQQFLAGVHGFTTWPEFIAHLEALSNPLSPVCRFEAAADAIAGGDLHALQQLLIETPELAHTRSTRQHRSTLLHYVSANGVENFRQITPKNIVGIASLLLNSGADVNAESDAYGGHSTALALTATSCHPEKAGVQLALMRLLLDAGANIDGSDGTGIVNSCLRNGRLEAAAFLAERGARLDLEAASGVGRLDVVRTFFAADGTLKPSATTQELYDGFAWACEFGHTDVAAFLLDHGIDLQSPRLWRYAQTGLHWAAYGGHDDIVRFLLARGASVNIADERFGATPLGWALHSWTYGPAPTSEDRFHHVVAMLVAAGAEVNPAWLADPTVCADPKMLAALTS